MKGAYLCEQLDIGSKYKLVKLGNDAFQKILDILDLIEGGYFILILETPLIIAKIYWKKFSAVMAAMMFQKEDLG
jgi:hypothetical protein